jgi:hypothetical protein
MWSLARSNCAEAGWSGGEWWLGQGNLQEPELEIVSVLAQLLSGLLKAEKDANQVLLGGRLGQVLDVQGL